MVNLLWGITGRGVHTVTAVHVATVAHWPLVRFGFQPYRYRTATLWMVRAVWFSQGAWSYAAMG